MSNIQAIRFVYALACGLLLSVGVSTAAVADSRTIKTTYGDVTIEGQPERIVTLYEGALDSALAVGAQPIGAIITRGGQSVAGYIQDEAGDIEIVGAPAETNLEAVIALQPDIILASPQTNADQYALLSRIAPTIVLDVPMFQQDSWRRELELFAKALGRQAEGQQVLDRVDNRIAEVHDLLVQTLPEDQRDTALVRWMPQGALIMAEGLFSATLLDAAGFEVDDADLVKDGRPHSQPLSQENLSLMDQNWIFLATLNEDGEQAVASARRSPAFQRLKANQADRVVPVDGQLWTSASGPLAAMAILDEIEAVLRGQ